MNPSPRIHVLLPVHNRRATTEQFLLQLKAQTYQNWSLVLIDDGSRDGTGEMARALVPSATVIRGQGHWWWAGALQQGYNWLKAARLPATDLVLTINDDSHIEPDFLARAVAAVRPRSLLLACCYDMHSGEMDAGISWYWPRLQYTVIREAGEKANCFSTRGLFLTVGDFLELGGFHPVLLPHYLSDYEFTHRAWRNGFKLISAPEVSLRDDTHQTGIRDIKGLSIWRSLRQAFSIRSASNPIFWTSFVILACPLRYVPGNILRVWRGFYLLARTEWRTRTA